MRTFRWFFCFVFGATAGSAIPVINPDGVVNLASYTPAFLPNGGIAQGSMFVVFGQGLGIAANTSGSRYPLPTTLAGTSVQITSGEKTASALMIYSSQNQVAGGSDPAFHYHNRDWYSDGHV